jgi:hypothetical protein
MLRQRVGLTSPEQTEPLLQTIDTVSRQLLALQRSLQRRIK